MASDTILTIVREVCGRIGLNKPSTATGSTDVQVQQLVSLANEEGKELSARTDWQELIREATFTTFATEDQGKIIGNRIPATPAAGTITATADGLKHIINDTMWNRTTLVSTPGPLTPSGWQGLKATTAGTGWWAQYRIRGGNLLFWPAPAVGQLVAFEYKTENWVSNANGDLFRRLFSADDDFPLLDSDIFMTGLSWRWKKAKGLAYAEDFASYENMV